MKTVLSRAQLFALPLALIFAGSAASASVCDIINNGNNYYAVSRDNQQFTNWGNSGDFMSAVNQRNSLIGAGVCNAAPAMACDVINNGNNYYSVSRNGQQFTNWGNSGDYESAIRDLEVLEQNHICMAPSPTASSCDIINNGNNYYAVSRANQQFTGWGDSGDFMSAIRDRHELVRAGLCRPAPVTSVCDVENNGNNYYAVSRDHQQFTNWGDNGDYKTAIQQRDALASFGVCSIAPAYESVCDIMNNGNNYYAVSRNGQQFTNWGNNGDFSSAIADKNNLVSSGVCVSR